MCTVSLIRTADQALRLACNRDELRARPPAMPPRIVQLKDRRAMMPIDPVGGGTWIAANDAGLVAVLINRTARGGPVEAEEPGAGYRSRGTIIPRILCADEIDAALHEELPRLQASQFRPFRLVLVGANGRCVEWICDGRFSRQYEHGDDWRWLLFTSSSLGDQRVDQPRRDLFRAICGQSGATISPLRQDTFHDHQWPQRPHLSVRMRRADARTVSRTIVELRRHRATMLYYDDAQRDAQREHLVMLDCDRTPTDASSLI